MTLADPTVAGQANPAPASCNRKAPPRILMIHPKFVGGSFWSLEAAVQLYGAEYPMPPLGLATVAALLPQDWPVRLLDRNVEPVTDADIAQADLIMTGGMLPQRIDLLDTIGRAQALGKKVVVGGPDVMSCPHIYEQADFMVLGEAEGLIEQFIAAWRRGDESGRFEGERAQVDVTTSPRPRFDLFNLRKYGQMTVQFSRGCPFTCEFCDIIELFGRRPRAKTHEQVFAELQLIYELGHRGNIFFVDDNLIGNKPAVRAFLRDLIIWQEEHGYPFDFSTEASINLADDPELMTLMSQAGFLGVFVGIESPDPEVLNATGKKQNTRRDIAESIHEIYAHGMSVMGGFIVGFDAEKGPVGDSIADLIEEAAIPVAMIGLLFALPETALTKRLEREGRMHPLPDPEQLRNLGNVDHCTQGLNFDTLRPRAEVLSDYRRVVARSYDLTAYHRRVRRMTDLLRFQNDVIDPLRSGVWKNVLFFLRLSWTLGIKAREGKRLYWGTLRHALRSDSRSLDSVMLCLGFLVHIGPFSKTVIKAIDAKIAELEQSGADMPAMEAAE